MTQKFQFQELILRKQKDSMVKKCIYVNVHNHIVYNNEKYRNNLSLQHMQLIKFGCYPQNSIPIEKNYTKAK